jgi:hypothetical protein
MVRADYWSISSVTEATWPISFGLILVAAAAKKEIFPKDKCIMQSQQPLYYY